MRSAVIPLIAPALLFAGMSISNAQDMVIKPDQQGKVREFVMQKKAKPVALPGVKLDVGATVPDSVTLTPLELDGMDKSYDYIVVSGRTYIIDPADRKVVQVME